MKVYVEYGSVAPGCEAVHPTNVVSPSSVLPATIFEQPTYNMFTNTASKHGDPVGSNVGSSASLVPGSGTGIVCTEPCFSAHPVVSIKHRAIAIFFSIKTAYV
jgi:hypothetical protein